jgi:AcrR family transcriptional regulator
MPPKRRGKRDTSYHHGDLREALVRAARTILEKQGLAALSLRGAARAAGVSPAAPYHHFPDKHALLDAVAVQGFDELTSAMDKRMAKQKGPSARLDASGVGYVVFALENPALFRLMFGGDGQQSSASASLKEARASLKEARASLKEARDRAYGVLQAAVAKTSLTGVADPLVCLRLWALVHGIATLILDGGINPAELGLGGGVALAARLLSRGQ